MILSVFDANKTAIDGIQALQNVTPFCFNASRGKQNRTAKHSSDFTRFFNERIVTRVLQGKPTESYER